MAITLNKLAKQCHKKALIDGKITETSSSTPLLYEISRNWRRLADATSFRSDRNPEYSEKEANAADVILSTITYLQRIGCKNIEQLLRSMAGIE